MTIGLFAVQQLYVAYFGRPMDPAGGEFYSNRAADILEVANAFSGSQESQQLYGGTSPAALVVQIYQNLFGRSPELAGLSFWTQMIANGSISAPEAAIRILQSAQLDDAKAVENKIIAANAFTAALDTFAEQRGYAGPDAAAAARAFLSTITSSDASIANLARIVAKAVEEATGTGTPPEDGPSSPVFSASISNGTITFAHPGEDISLSVATNPALVYTFTSSGSMTGTSAVTVTGLVADIVVPAGTVLSIMEANFLSIPAFTGAGTIKITDPADYVITASLLQSFDDAVDGLLDATAYTKINGTVAELTAILVTNQGTAGNKIKTATDVAVQITGTTTATAAELKTIEAATTGFVDATAITFLTGTIADAKLMLVTNKGTSGDKIGTSGTITVTLSDTGAASAADIKAIDAATTGLVSATGITEITGSNTDINAVLNSSRHNTSVLDLAGLTEIIFTTAVQAADIPANSIRNDTTITLADVSGNHVSITSGIVLPGRALTIDGTALTGTNHLVFDQSSYSSTPVTVRGGAGNDVFRGGLGNDLLYGGGGNDKIEGDDGDDMIYGEAGNDTLFGGYGNDTIFGGDGDDRIDGGNGADILTGGAGADIFRYFEPMQGGDTITDFSSEDRILVSELDFPGYGTVIQLSGTGAFSDAMLPNGDGALVLYTNTNTGIMQLIADYNGDGVGYSYTVVTFAAGTTATIGQIQFYDSMGDGWGG